MHAHLCMCAYAWLRYTAGPAEYMGTIGICPNQLLKKRGFFEYRHSSIYAVNVGTHEKMQKQKLRNGGYLVVLNGEENRIEL